MAQNLARDEAGNVWEVDAQGNAVRLVTPAQAQPNVIPPNPTRVQQRERELARQTSADARSAAADARAADKADREAREWAATHNPDGSPKPTASRNGSAELTAATRANAINAFTATRQLDNLIRDIEGQYRSGPGATKGISGVQDWLPTPTNRRFDAAGNAVRGAAITALGFTSGQTNTPREVEQNIGPYIPSAGDYDQVIEDKIARLKELRDRARVQAVTVLGGVPSADGRITPLSQVPAQEREALFPPGTMQPTSDDRQRIDGTLSVNGSGGNSPPPGGSGGRPLLGADEMVAFGGDARPVTGFRFTPEQQSLITKQILSGDIEGGVAIANQLSGGQSGIDAKTARDVFTYAKKNPGWVPNWDASAVDQAAQTAADRERYGDYLPEALMERTGAGGATGRGLLTGATVGAAPYLAAGLQSGFGLAPLVGGNSFTDRLQRNRAIDEADRVNNFGYRLGGEIVGGAGSAFGIERGLATAATKLPGALSGVVGSPRTADALFGGTTAAFRSDGDPFAATAGAGAGALGGMFGRSLAKPIAAAGRGVGRVLGREVAPVPNAADRSLYGALEKGGLDDVTASLNEARALGLPMTLADTTPAARSLAGAAVRRSPNASGIAEGALLPRARGQIDRFGQAIERDLGPVANVPQLSQDMTRAASEAAAPLYRQAYATPVPHTPELESLLGTPFGRQAIGRARTIAANERRNPMELGFAEDAAGNPVLNPQPSSEMAAHLFARQELDAAQNAYRAARNGEGDVVAARQRVEDARNGLRSAETALSRAPDPSMNASVPAYTTQTLDYAKRGMDDVLEQYRNPITNRLVLDEAGRAQNDVKNSLLREVDRLNTPYREARATYAGPVQSRDALMRGQDAVSLNPSMLQMQVANQTPEHLGQMQLGYRSGLMDRADQVRFSSNPFDATLGTPAAEQRLATMFPDNPGVANLLRQRDLEGQMARTNNDILGNSKTAERTIADQSFGGSGLPGAAMDVGLNVAMGQVPTSAIRNGLGRGLRDMTTLGIGKKATQRAEALAPMMFNTIPEENLAEVARIAAALQGYRDTLGGIKRITSPIGGMFGASAVPALGGY